MILAPLLAVGLGAAAPDPVSVERAFAADARKLGQWTAFRSYAAPNAVMFVPQQVEADRYLRGRADPPSPLSWQPVVSFQSCDGSLAIDQGPWQDSGSRLGRFTTVWLRAETSAGRRWMWVYDGGETLTRPLARAARAVGRRASCTALPANVPDADSREQGFLPPPDAPMPTAQAHHSADYSLRYAYWSDASGRRTFRAWLWKGRAWQLIIDQKIAA
ncbi:hypothetical protein HMF7854_01680 [Sphingomonas ginkgonis]|uniref:Uncharacterized protein n=1 Tax=Sphingomonas ginkgonis TaxID=2315330 RepID=A0A3R9YKM3_9SPHN|nr:hypothetical protein [Sphingomonas ginkgonis]RST29679.1 hypothetical protein HMF7854_01680 [Sphingomonas ginkgonis]